MTRYAMAIGWTDRDPTAGVRGYKSKEIHTWTESGLPSSSNVGPKAPASGSQFALLPPDNATGNFTKIVQRVPVKIVLDPGQVTVGQLRPGLSVIAAVRTNGATN